MPALLGPKGIKTALGEDAWKMYSVAEYVNTCPGRDIPFPVCISGTGRDGGHTSEFGWQDDPRGTARTSKPKPGEKFKCASTSLKNDQVQSGKATADRWGLVTLRGVQVDKGKSRIVISAR